MIILVSSVCCSHGLSDAPEATMQLNIEILYTVDAAPQALRFGDMYVGFLMSRLLPMLSRVGNNIEWSYIHTYIHTYGVCSGQKDYV